MKKLLFLAALFFASALHAASVEVHDPCTIVIFGATGDLTARKIFPAIYNLAKDGHLSDKVVIIGAARRPFSDDSFRKEMEKAIDTYSRTKKDSAFWEEFAKKIHYKQVDFKNAKNYEDLRLYLKKIDKEYGTQGNRLYFLATQGSQFTEIVQNLHAHNLIYKPKNKVHWSKVLIEKPFGHDLESAEALQNHISKYLDESQVYRLDHYLGKEGVQNLFSFRFENGLFEPLWNKDHIESVQITISEEIGIGSRAHFWEETGLLRDIFQNHLMQLLCLVAMEPPASLQQDHIHAEKIKLLQKVRPFPPGAALEETVIRGQYGPGLIKGTNVLSYREEKDVPKTSLVETFAAAKIFIDNERWQGVPFYVRAGKRLPKQTVEIAIAFKNSLDQLFIRIQPNAGIFMKTLAKKPGLSQEKVPVTFGYQLEKDKAPEAYEKLIYDALLGDHSLFVQADEQLAAWRLLTPVLKYWEDHPPKNFPNYQAGTWGPENASRFLSEWHLLEN